MVAIVTGNSLGLAGSSANVLGSGGQFGTAATGLGGDAAYVNAKTGNLTISRQDELLIGRGPDIGVVRTYNSNGTFDFDNNDNWQLSLYRQIASVTGGTGVNTAGSSLTRTGADGALLTYTYDSTAGSPTLGKYVNKDGSGSYDTLSYASGTNQWTWTDGNTRTTETYAVNPTDSTKWRITNVADLDGNSLTYTYDATTGVITQVTDANGESTQLIYNAAKQLLQINEVNSSNVTTTRIRYTYDSNTPSRLISVSTDLTPADGSIADGKTYTTSYSYDGTSNRIQTIKNVDSTNINNVISQTAFEYDASNRINKITDGVGNVTTLSYVNATTTTITDASGVTTLTYDANGQLTNLAGPSGSGKNITYTYNASGDVTQTKDNVRNLTVNYTYDTKGNQLSQQDSAGNTIIRTFGSLNELLTETVYTDTDATPTDTTITVNQSQTTNYIYSTDSKNHLRYVISPEGRVTEYRYEYVGNPNAQGQRTSAIQYTTLYTGTRADTALTTWLTAAIKAKSQRMDYTYDLRGQLSKTTVFAKVDTSTNVTLAGTGIADGSEMATRYVYDQSGNLLQTIDARSGVTNYSYDGLNRIITQTDALSYPPTATVYNDATRQVVVTLANGLSTTSTYDQAGRLLSVAKNDASGALGTTSYRYDALGNLRQVTDPLNQKSYYIYDSLNRVVGQIDENGYLTETIYNSNNQVVRSIRYWNQVTTPPNDANALSITLASVRPTADTTNDRSTRNIYDKAGRLAKQIDALGAVTEYTYDGVSRLIKTTQYATALTAAQLTSIDSTAGDVIAGAGTITLVATNTVITLAVLTTDRTTRQFYSNDGLLVGTLSGEGFFTAYSYDAAGHLISKLAYATATTAITGAAPATTAADQKTSYIYNAAGQLTGMVDPEGYLTEYQYDLNGNQTQQIRYATKITYVAGNTIDQSRPALNAEDQTQTSIYDADNRLTLTTSSPDGLITQYVYDSVGNLSKAVKTFSGAASTQERKQQMQYNSLGQLTAQLSGEGVIALIGLGSTPTQTQIDTIWNTYGTRYSYDLAGHRISMTTPDGTGTSGNKTLYYYDNEGKLVYSINALGEVSQNTYNAFDQVTATRQYATRLSATTLSSLTGGLASTVSSTINALTSSADSITQVGYDRDGQITSLTDALGNVNSRTYNLFGELASRTDKIDASNTLVTSYTYDRRGLQVSTTEDSGGIGRLTSAIYDAFGRITQTTDGRGGLIKHIYDRLGRETTTTDALNTNTLTTYDAFSRILTQVDGRNNTTTYSYNSTNRTMTMTSAEGISLTTEKNRYGETVKLTDGRNNITTYSYNANGQLIGVLNADGSTTAQNYDKAGRILSTTDARGTVTTYSYDAANRILNKTIDPTSVNPTGLNLSSSYRYDALGRQIWTQDAKGIWTRTDYDVKGQVTAITVDPTSIPDASGNPVANASGLNLQTTYTYDARGKRLTVTEGAGSSQPRTTQYVYDKLGRRIQSIIDPHIIVTDSKLAITTSYAYDKNDNLVLKTDANGNKTVYTYDADNQQTATIDALGYVTKRDYDLNGNVLTITAYGTAMTAANLTTIQTNAANGAQMNIATSTSQAVSVSGSTVTITVATSATVDRISRSVYDKDNRLTFSIDAAGYVTQLAYDATGNVVKRTRYANAIVTPAAGVAPSILAAAGTSNYVITSTSDRVEQTVYDTMNRATVNVDAAGYVTAYSYDANSNLISSTRYANLMQGTLVTNTPPSFVTTTGNYVITSASDQTTRNYYDNANRRTGTVDAEGYVTAYSYDASSNLSSSTRTLNRASTVTATSYTVASNANDQVTTSAYDNAGRIISQQRGADGLISYSYDALGNLTDRIQAGGTSASTTTHYVYDTAGRVTDETHGYGTTAATTTHYDYDALGHQVKITEGYGTTNLRITQQFFDLIGQKTQAKDALNNTTTTTYNAFGDIVKVLDARGASGYFYTDALGRVTLQLMPEGSTPAENNFAAVASTYDAFGNLTSTLRYATRITAAVTTGTLPTLTAVPASDQKQTFAYDKLNRKTTVQTWTGPTTSTASTDYYTESFTYDAYSNVLTSTARNGAITSYTYDKLGRKLTETLPVQARNISNVLVNVQNTFAYDANGNLTSKTEAFSLLEARTTTYTYDQLGRQLTESVNVGQTYNPATDTTTPNVIATKTTTYDGRGNITSTQAANLNTTYYYYDALDRRVGQVDAAQVYTSYSYDVVGNKTSQTVYANPVTNPVIGTTPSIVADAANDRTTYYSYDLVGRQTGTTIQNIRTGSVNAANQYIVVTGNITTQTVYDALGNITKTIDANGNITRTWYNNAGQTVAQVDALGYLTTWARDVYGNISQETRYANKAQVMGTATLDTGIPQILTTAPAAGSNAVYVLSDATNDRTTAITFDKLNRVKTETVQNVVSGTVSTTNGALTPNASTIGAITSYTYDGLNNVTQKTDAVGAITNFVYDALGRQISELDPTFTDYTGAAVRPETDKEYDGLGNVKREIVRGTNNTATSTTNSGQIETDDHITTYEYTNGRLSAQVDPAGIRTEYQYDANGNVTKKVLRNRQTADQQINNQAGTDDVTTYSYDSLNRQLKTKDIGTGLIAEVQYNSFGQITGKRSYVINAQNPTAPTTWTEFAQYDQAGRAWKSNSGDGVTKVYVYDANGNATLTINGTLDMTSMTLDQVLAQKSLDTTNNVTQQTFYTMSVFDARNQQINTIQPSMDSTKDVVQVQAATGSGEAVFVPSAPTTGTINSNQAATNPLVGGGVGITGNATFGMTYSGVNQPIGMGQFAFRRYFILSSIPDTSALGSGQLRIVVTWNSPTPTILYSSGQSVSVQVVDTITPPVLVSVSIYKQTQTLGEIQLGNYTSFTAGTFSLASASQTKLVLTGQPTQTSKVLLSYRPAGSSGAYTTVSVPQMVNTAGAAMGGMYAFDWSSLTAGNYEYQYAALGSSGAILNQQSGTFNTTTASAPTASAQTAIAMGGPGHAFVVNNAAAGLVNNGLQLVDQGASASTVSMKYRVKGSGSAWTTIPASSFISGSATLGFGPGSFTLPTSALSTFANSTIYETDFEVRDSSGGLVRYVSADLTVDASGNKNMGALTVHDTPWKARLVQPTTAQYVDIQYRIAGSGTAYSAPVRVTTISSGSGLFDWDASSLPAGNYDIDVQALNSDGIILNHNQVNATLTSGTISVTNTNAINDVPQVLRVTPPQTGVDHIQLVYRLKGSTSDYAPLTTYQYNNNGVIEFRAALPSGASALAAGLYEYQYTTYAPDTVDPNDASNIIVTPLGSDTGAFTVAATNTNNTRLDYVITSTASSSNLISRKQSYNAFGEVVQEIDGNGNVTNYAYNTMGKLLQKKDPQVDITLANGFVQVASEATRPTTTYTYDLIGRLIGVKDANNNLNTQAWVNGFSSDAIPFEKHADSGSKSAQYDIFGNKRVDIDEVARRTDYTYDNDNRLTRIDRPQRVAGTTGYLATRTYDLYSYDAAGQRISHTNSIGDTEKTSYDSLGRVIRTASFMGFATTYTYNYSNTITGIAGITGSGWIKTTTGTDGRAQIDRMDMFNRVTWHQDEGNHVFTYNYNRAGWLMSQTSLAGDTLPAGTTNASYTGQNIAYTHYSNGFIQSIQDKATGVYTYYEYDQDGNKTFEGYVSLKNPLVASAGAKDYYEYSTITYDAMNRIKTITDPKASISYEYDAVGNRRYVKSVYHDGVNGAQSIQQYWYSYDQMNRFTITMGSLAITSTGVATTSRGTSATDTTRIINKGTTGTAAAPIATSTGVAISYNLAGERVQAANATDGSTESYTYTSDGYLSDTKIKLSTQTAFVLRASRVNDALGRVTTVNQYSSGDATGAGTTLNYTRSTTYDQDNRTLTESGTDGTTNYFYYSNNTDSANSAGGAGALAYTSNLLSGTTTKTYYSYQYWDEAKQKAITTQPYNSAAPNWKAGYSDMRYDANGHFVGANDAGSDGIKGTADDLRYTYVNDAQGQILLRSEIAGGSVNRIQRFYYVDGKRVGDVGNSGPSNTDYVTALANQKVDKKAYKNWKPVASADFDQNYQPIGLNYPGQTATSYTVRNGDTLQSIARTVWGDAAMWYLIADANGLASGSNLTTGQVLTIPNKVTNVHNNSGTFKVYNAGEAIGDVSPTIPAAPPPPSKHGGCGGLGIIAVAVIAVVATVMTAGALAPAAASLGSGFAGTFATGLSVLSGSAVAAGTISATAALGVGLAADAIGSILSQAVGMAIGVQSKFSWSAVATSALTTAIAPSPFGSSTDPLVLAGNAVARNVVGQGVGIITGQQRSFSWSSVAVSAVSAPATQYLTDKLKIGAIGSSPGADLARATTGALVAATSQMAIQGGRLNWTAVAADTVTGLIQNRAQSSVTPVSSNQVGGQITLDGDTSGPSVKFNQAQQDSFSAQIDEAMKPNRNGLYGTYVDTPDYMLTPQQLNARNGGLNVTGTDSPYASNADFGTTSNKTSVDPVRDKMIARNVNNQISNQRQLLSDTSGLSNSLVSEDPSVSAVGAQQGYKSKVTAGDGAKRFRNDGDEGKGQFIQSPKTYDPLSKNRQGLNKEGELDLGIKIWESKGIDNSYTSIPIYGDGSLISINSSYSIGAADVTLTKDKFSAKAGILTATELQLASSHADLLLGTLDTTVRSAIDFNASADVTVGKKDIGINAGFGSEAVALQARGEFTSKPIDLLDGLITLKVKTEGALNAGAIGGSVKGGVNLNMTTYKASVYGAFSADVLFGAKAGSKVDVDASKLFKQLGF